MYGWTFHFNFFLKSTKTQIRWGKKKSDGKKKWMKSNIRKKKLKTKRSKWKKQTKKRSIGNHEKNKQTQKRNVGVSTFLSKAIVSLIWNYHFSVGPWIKLLGLAKITSFFSFKPNIPKYSFLLTFLSSIFHLSNIHPIQTQCYCTTFKPTVFSFTIINFLHCY